MEVSIKLVQFFLSQVNGQGKHKNLLPLTDYLHVLRMKTKAWFNKCELLHEKIKLAEANWLFCVSLFLKLWHKWKDKEKTWEEVLLSNVFSGVKFEFEQIEKRLFKQGNTGDISIYLNNLQVPNDSS